MDKVTFITKESINGLEFEYAIIDKGEGAYVSMLKSDYDKLQAEQSTPSVIHEAETK